MMEPIKRSCGECGRDRLFLRWECSHCKRMIEVEREPSERGEVQITPPGWIHIAIYPLKADDAFTGEHFICDRCVSGVLRSVLLLPDTGVSLKKGA